MMKRRTGYFSFMLLLLLIFAFRGKAADGHQEKVEEFNLVEFAMHHIGDAYSWDFYKKKDGSSAGFSLPRILYNKKESRLHLYWSTEKAITRGAFIDEHHLNPEAGHGKLLIPGSEEAYKEIYEALAEEENKEKSEALQKQLQSFRPLDFSFTKSAFYMLLISLLLVWIFLSIARRYSRNPDQAPKGIQSFFEPIIIFIRDDVARVHIHGKGADRYMPLLLNLFFFILFLNLAGLLPFAANVTGNISVTATLAIITGLIIIFSGNKSYWEHIFWFPGIPVFVKPIMLVAELVSLVVKPFALAIRLFANITAGHLVIFAFVSLIFVFGKLGQEPGIGYATSVISVLFALFINMIEILIALLQAYIFTTLSALFIGQAVSESH
jgi:F-type H+-transporting ATPase subunit a